MPKYEVYRARPAVPKRVVRVGSKPTPGDSSALDLFADGSKPGKVRGAGTRHANASAAAAPQMCESPGCTSKAHVADVPRRHLCAKCWTAAMRDEMPAIGGRENGLGESLAERTEAA